MQAKLTASRCIRSVAFARSHTPGANDESSTCSAPIRIASSASLESANQLPVLRFA